MDPIQRSIKHIVQGIKHIPQFSHQWDASHGVQRLEVVSWRSEAASGCTRLKGPGGMGPREG